MNKIAQIDLFEGTGLRGFGPLGLESRPGQSGTGVFTTFLSSTIGIMTIIAIIWFIFVFITGAISIINAGGDKAALETARKKIISGITGLVVTIAAIFLIDLIGNLIGIPNLLDIGALLDRITP